MEYFNVWIIKKKKLVYDIDENLIIRFCELG